MSKHTSIYKTHSYPATSIYQNHLDELMGLLEIFQSENKNFAWGLLVNNRKIVGSESVAAYISKNYPDAIKFYIESNNNRGDVLITIDNGISVTVKNGSHALYGLFKQIMDVCENMTSTHVYVFLRRNWLASLLISIFIVPSLLILILGGGWLVIAWILFALVAEIFTVLWLLDTSDWEDYMLSTKINYGTYNTRTLSPFGTLFGSTRSAISLLASLATVITFIIFLNSNR